MTVTCEQGARHLLMVERDDGHGWAVPGGAIEPGENPTNAALRELAEETGLQPDRRAGALQTLPARYVPDPRATNEAWMVTVPTTIDLGTVEHTGLPVVRGADDAVRAAWCCAPTYGALENDLWDSYRGGVFAAHQEMLRGLPS